MFFTQTSPFFRINLSSEPLTTAQKSDIIKNNHKNNHKKAVKRNSTRRMRRRERAVGESPAQRSANPSLSCGAQQVLPNYAPSDAPVKEL